MTRTRTIDLGMPLTLFIAIVSADYAEMTWTDGHRTVAVSLVVFTLFMLLHPITIRWEWDS